MKANETYDGFPVADPSFTFLDALNALNAPPYNAREIDAWYVIRTAKLGDVTPQPVWVISLRGITPPVPFSVPANPAGNVTGNSDASVDANDSQTEVINAFTGKVLFDGYGYP